jgi:hypothetical protein
LGFNGGLGSGPFRQGKEDFLGIHMAEAALASGGKNTHKAHRYGEKRKLHEKG